MSPYSAATTPEGRRDKLTETLRRVVSEIERLPADEQDRIAHELQVRLEEREWDALVRSPSLSISWSAWQQRRMPRMSKARHET